MSLCVLNLIFVLQIHWPNPFVKITWWIIWNVFSSWSSLETFLFCQCKEKLNIKNLGNWSVGIKWFNSNLNPKFNCLLIIQHNMSFYNQKCLFIRWFLVQSVFNTLFKINPFYAWHTFPILMFHIFIDVNPFMVWIIFRLKKK